jgi:hypothetical protein
MVEAYHQIHEGRLTREQVVPLADPVKVGGSGVLQPLHAGLNLTIQDLLWLMISGARSHLVGRRLSCFSRNMMQPRRAFCLKLTDGGMNQ